MHRLRGSNLEWDRVKWNTIISVGMDRLRTNGNL